VRLAQGSHKNDFENYGLKIDGAVTDFL